MSIRIVLLFAIVACSTAESAPRDDPPRPTAIAVTVGPAGGLVELRGGPRLAIPPGALAADRTITITQLGERFPVGALGPAYAFAPRDLVFAHPVHVEFPGDGDIHWRDRRLPGREGWVTELGVGYLVPTGSGGREAPPPPPSR